MTCKVVITQISNVLAPIILFLQSYIAISVYGLSLWITNVRNPFYVLLWSEHGLGLGKFNVISIKKYAWRN